MRPRASVRLAPILRSFFAAALVTLLPSIFPAPARASQPVTYALLIGVSKYAFSGLPDLDGPMSDVALMQRVLRDRFQVPAANIRVITNALASHSRIQAAFADLKMQVDIRPRIGDEAASHHLPTVRTSANHVCGMLGRSNARDLLRLRSQRRRRLESKAQYGAEGSSGGSAETFCPRTKEYDFIYVHYSGHGSTAVDPSDRRGEDQTWVAYRARARQATGLDRFDVLDKEIGTWLNGISSISYAQR